MIWNIEFILDHDGLGNIVQDLVGVDKLGSLL
jgi:hypothetical protein